jgi:5-formyltetrahydrofolate cyclo-ligase
VAEARGVLTCLSFGDELDTWGLVEGLLAAGKEVYVPRADPRDRRLHVHRYPCELETLSFGLRQPPRLCPELPEERIGEEIGAVLVLGLGFDRRCYRLGHGGGYFDRFFAEHRRRPRPRAVGLAYEVQVVDRLPVEEHDVPMDVVVTEERVVRASPVAP